MASTMSGSMPLRSTLGNSGLVLTLTNATAMATSKAAKTAPKIRRGILVLRGLSALLRPGTGRGPPLLAELISLLLHLGEEGSICRRELTRIALLHHRAIRLESLQPLQLRPVQNARADRCCRHNCKQD